MLKKFFFFQAIKLALLINDFIVVIELTAIAAADTGKKKNLILFELKECPNWYNNWRLNIGAEVVHSTFTSVYPAKQLEIRRQLLNGIKMELKRLIYILIAFIICSKKKKNVFLVH